MTNKEIVYSFYQEIFQQGNVQKIPSYVQENYIQHNPTVATGRQGFTEFITKFLARNPEIDIINISSEDDFVYVFFKCVLEDGTVNKVCDIYRLEDGKLAEHWDVIEHNIGQIDSVNDNGLF